MQDPSTGEWSYEGWENTISYLTTICAVQGPFDGLWAFSQARLVPQEVLARLFAGTLKGYTDCICYVRTRAVSHTMSSSECRL